MRKSAFYLWVFVLIFAGRVICQQWWNIGTDGLPNEGEFFNSIAIDDNGTPYVVCADISGNPGITIKKFVNENWEVVGEPNLAVNPASVAISYNGTPYIAFSDPDSGLTVMKYDGESWEVVGNTGLSDYFALNISIVLDNSGIPYVVCTLDNGGPYLNTVIKYTGDSWEAIGAPGFNDEEIQYTVLAISPNGTPYIAYDDPYTSQLIIKKYDNGSWIVAGSSNLSNYYNPGIVIDSSGIPYISCRFWDGGRELTAVLKFDGSNWQVIGETGFADASDISLTINNEGILYAAFRDESNLYKATVMNFNNGNWQLIGSAGFSNEEISDIKILISPNGIPVVAYTSTFSGTTTIMKYSLNQNDPLPVEKSGESLPYKFALKQNYPNPFNPVTNIKYSLPETLTLGKAEAVTLKIYNLLGQEVATLVNKQQTTGNYEVKFDASQLASGVYLYKLHTREFTSVRKLLLLK